MHAIAVSLAISRAQFTRVKAANWSFAYSGLFSSQTNKSLQPNHCHCPQQWSLRRNVKESVFGNPGERGVLIRVSGENVKSGPLTSFIETLLGEERCF